MIARVWSAHTTLALSNAYLEHFSQQVQPALQKLNGFRGFTVCTHSSAAETQVVVITYWESLAAIDAFAGPDRESAVVTPEAAALLTDYDRRVRHYAVALASFPHA